MTSKIVPSLPKIQATVGHIPQKLKHAHFENPRARLEVLRTMVTKLVREERAEFRLNRAVECRPYMERLLQLAICRGPDDEYTNKMMDWWLKEPHLKDKVFGELATRLKDTDAPYTYLLTLPAKRMVIYKDKKIERPRNVTLAMLEINGNPFPSVKRLEEARFELLKQTCLG